MKKNELFIMGLIVFLAFIVRIPGVFWGYHIFGEENIGFHVAESPLAINANRFLNMNFKEDFYMDYAFGFPFHIAFFAFPLKLFMDLSLPMLVGIGRLLSVFYALCTIILIYFLSKCLFKSKKVGIVSALFLALSGLHIMYSHYAKADVPSIFWIYAAFYFSYLFVQKDKNIFLLLATFSAGAAAAIKFVVITIIPLVYIAAILLKRRKLFEILLIILVLAGSFAVNNGFMYTLQTFRDSVDLFSSGTFNVRDYNKLWNPLIYIINLLTGLSLVISFFFLYGLTPFFKKINKDIFFIIILPFFFFFIQIYFIEYAAPKYILSIVPLAAIIAGFGFIKFTNLFNNKKIISILFLFILIYQILYVYSIEFNYINDPRKIMGEWMLENIDNNESIYIGEPTKGIDNKTVKNEGKGKNIKNRGINKEGVILPSEFKTIDKSNYLKAKYIAILDDGRYTSSYMNPFKMPKCCNEAYGCFYEDCILAQDLIKNNSHKGVDYKLIKEVKPLVLTPELKIYNHYFKTFQAIGDFLLYEKIK